jgi:two-component system chemotaxis sensor kinase CheA
MAPDPYRYFRIEARELLEQLGQGLLDLEKGAGDAQTVVRLLRVAHTLKGAARVVRQREIADHAHALEELLGPWRDSPAVPAREPVDAALALLDAMGSGLAALSPPAPVEVAATDRPATPPDPTRTLRAEVTEMDQLLGNLTQAHAQIAVLRRGLASTLRALGLADVLADQLDPRRGRIDAALPASHAMAEELRGLLGGVERGLAASVDQMDRELRLVRDGAEQLRLVPAALLFTPLERTVRDAAHQLGRRVVFEARGGALRLDAEWIEVLQGALLQMVRNAVAHGIESEAARIAAGKPVQGRVVVEVARRGRDVVFSCSDDGAGIDVDAVRRAAQRQGWTAPALPALDGPGLLALLMRSGLSTASTVTEVAGRGIGLDVVRDAVERLGGRIDVQTTPGAGTRLELRVPMSVTSLQALVVEAGGRRVALPLDAVQCALRHGPQDLARTARGESLLHDGAALAHVWLGALLQPARPPARTGPASVLIVEGVVDGVATRAAIGVDRILGTATLVLRPLPALAPASALVAGTSMDVEGRPQIVLDADGLVAHAQSAGVQQAGPAPARLPVLVVDDSLTTRMLEQSILESAGYAVHAAVSAEDGLERARRQRYGLFLVDVEMPGMDGFAFIEHAGADPALRDVPAILVTSRCSPEDRRRGEQVGARGYIVKSEFVQADFLRQVEQLVQSS